MSTRIEIDREALEITGKRTVRQSGNSVTVAFPPEILQGTGIERGDEVELRADIEDGTILVQRVAAGDGDGSSGDGDGDGSSGEN